MPLDEPLYPMNLRVAGHRCLVVGGGEVAAQKIRGLLDCQADVTVVALEIHSAVRELDVGTLHLRAYQSIDIEGMRIAIAATGDPTINAAVLADGRAAGVLVNSADDPQHCDFTLPSRVRQGPLLITASTQGRSPAMATWLRRRFSAEFGPEYGVLLNVLAEAREDLRESGLSTEGLGWQKALDSGMLELVREGRIVEAKERLQACLSSLSE